MKREGERERQNGSRLEVHVAPSSRSGHGETRKAEAGADGEVRLRLVARARGTSPWVNTLRDAPLPPPPPSPPTAPITTTRAAPVYVRSTPRATHNLTDEGRKRLSSVSRPRRISAWSLSLDVSNYSSIYLSILLFFAFFPLSFSASLFVFSVICYTLILLTLSPISMTMTHTHRHDASS